jgi:hypothetical protein
MFLLIITTFFGLAFLPPDAGEMEKEKEAIKQAALDYMEGWYEGSAERMERALHPDLVKRRMKELPTGKNILDTVSALSMIEYARAGFGKGKPVAEHGVEVKVLDVYKTIACAKALSDEYVDYLHLVKHNGTWKIANVLWEVNLP